MLTTFKSFQSYLLHHSSNTFTLFRVRADLHFHFCQPDNLCLPYSTPPQDCKSRSCYHVPSIEDKLPVLIFCLFCLDHQIQHHKHKEFYQYYSKMRPTVLGCALWAVSAFSSPLRKRDIVTDNVIVTDEVIVTVIVMPGSQPAATLATAPVTKVAVPNNANNDYYYSNDNNNAWGGNTWTWGLSRPPFSSSSTSTSSPAVVSMSTPPPSPSLSSVTAAPPPPQSAPNTPTSSAASTSSAPSTPSCNLSPNSGGIPILCTVNKWRKAYSLRELGWNSTLEANAQKTGTDNGGVNENHELNPGSMAQVITPGLQTALSGKDMGGDSPFELAYVGWLCEVAGDPQLANGNQCGIVKNIENMVYSDAGHHDILNSATYSQIGCAFAANPAAASGSPYQGVWVCDLC